MSIAPHLGAARDLRQRLAVLTITLLSVFACHDLPTAPTLIKPPRPPLHDLTTDPKWGRNASPDAGNWDGVISAWDGGTALGDPWYFPYRTYVVVNIDGDVIQGDGAYKGAGKVSGPTGYTNINGLFGAIGFRLANATGSSMWWPQPNKTTDTVAVQNEMRPVRMYIDGAQPRSANPNDCGANSNRTPPWPCYVYSGKAHLDFRRLHVDLTLSPSADMTVESETSITFTASPATPTIKGSLVDLSELTWKWEPDQPLAGDTTVCMSQSGNACTRVFETSGTLWVSAYVNGEQQERSVRVAVIGRRPQTVTPCSSDTALKKKYPWLATPEADSVKRERFNWSMSMMMENGVTINSIGGVVSYKYDYEALPLTPCEVKIGYITSAALATMHVHMGKEKQDATKMCRTDFPTVWSGGPTPTDWIDHRRLQLLFPTLKGIVLGPSVLTVYYYEKTPSGELERRTDPYPRCGY